MATMMQDLTEALATCETLLPLSDAPAPALEDNRPHSISWTEACQTVGNILTSMGFVVEAFPWRSMALDLTPDITQFYAESGRIYGECEVWDRAIYYWQRTLENKPDDLSVRQRLAKAYNQIGDYRSESKVINEVLEIRPDAATADGHLQLGWVMQKQGQIEQAKLCFQRAIEQNDSLSAAYYALGDLLLRQGQKEKAIELFEQFVEQLATEDPEKAMAHYRLGRAYRQAQQFEQAVTHFRLALEINDHLHWAYMGLMNVLMQLGQWDEVIKTCQVIIQTVEAFPWAYCFMGNALSKKGDSSAAAAAHQQSFRLRGWQRCADQEYEFGQTWFSENIPIWESHMAQFNEPGVWRDPMHVLSLGSSDSSSLCWLADQVLRHPGDQLTCITPAIPPDLQKTVAKLLQSTDASGQVSDKVIFSVGDISHQLSVLSKELSEALDRPAPAEVEAKVDAGVEIEVEAFEIIYIQSDEKQGDYIKAIATQAWPLLKPSGLMIFKDYQWRHPQDPDQASRVGIDAFIASVTDEVEILNQSHQLILKKAPAFNASR